MGYGRVKAISQASKDRKDLIAHQMKKNLYGAIGMNVFRAITGVVTGGVASPWAKGLIDGITTTVGLKVGMDAAGSTPDTDFYQGTAEQIDEMDSSEVLGANFLNNAVRSGMHQKAMLEMKGLEGQGLDFKSSPAGKMINRVKINQQARDAGFKPWSKEDRSFMKSLYEFEAGEDITNILATVQANPGVTSAMDASMIHGAMYDPNIKEYPEMFDMFNTDGSFNRGSDSYMHYLDEYKSQGMTQEAFENMMEDSYITRNKNVDISANAYQRGGEDKRWWESTGSQGTYTTSYPEPVYAPSSDVNNPIGSLYSPEQTTDYEWSEAVRRLDQMSTLDKLYGSKNWVFDQSIYKKGRG